MHYWNVTGFPSSARRKKASPSDITGVGPSEIAEKAFSVVLRIDRRKLWRPLVEDEYFYIEITVTNIEWIAF